jgi:hypothetical protein
MAYKFSPVEFSLIDSALVASESGVAPWWELYGVVSKILKDALSEGRVSISDVQQTEAARLWFDGAVLVNKGEGFFSALIREYTTQQFEYRFGSSDSAQVASKMQSVSDEIARKVVDGDILTTGILPLMVK